MDSKDLGLRERKRLETRSRLEIAAIELVACNGLEETTVEAISERANVSTRTFFNYFESKEEAILGLYHFNINDDMVASHLDSHRDAGLIESIVALMIDTFGQALTDPALYKKRKKIIRQYPQLLERQINQTVHVSKQLMTVIQDLAKTEKGLQVSEAQAEVIVALCVSGVRISIREWVEANGKVSLPKLKERTIQIINEAIKKIQ